MVSDEIDLNMLVYCTSALGLFIPPMVQSNRANLKATTVTNAKNSFQKGGYWPLNRFTFNNGNF